MRNEVVPSVNADLVSRLREATGWPIVICAKAIAEVPEDQRIVFVEQVERGEKRIGPPDPK